MNINIIIFHKYGDPQHFKGLYYLAKKKNIDLEFVEFNLIIQIFRVFRKKLKLRKFIQNLKYFFKLLVLKDETIIIGAAPYEKIIPFLNYIKKRNNVIYFTSCPDWRLKSSYIQLPHFRYFVYKWLEFINGIKAVTVSKAAKRQVTLLGAKATHIPHCINTELFKPQTNDYKKDKIIRILFVGSLIQRKGVPLILDLINSKDWKNVEFWFVGKGPYSRKLAEMEDQNKIKYFGHISSRRKLAKIYQMCDIFILPSIREPFGIVLLEAVSSGIPCLVANSVGPSEIIDDKFNGLIIEKNNLTTFIDALEFLISHTSMREKMGKNARIKAVKEYDIKVISKKWKKVLNNFIEEMK